MLGTLTSLMNLGAWNVSFFESLFLLGRLVKGTPKIPVSEANMKIRWLNGIEFDFMKN